MSISTITIVVAIVLFLIIASPLASAIHAVFSVGGAL